MRKHHKFIITSVLVLIIICGVPAEGDALKKASFIPQWVPQAQFAAFGIPNYDICRINAGQKGQMSDCRLGSIIVVGVG